jgi:hypothetical protein
VHLELELPELQKRQQGELAGLQSCAGEDIADAQRRWQWIRGSKPSRLIGRVQACCIILDASGERKVEKRTKIDVVLDRRELALLDAHDDDDEDEDEDEEQVLPGTVEEYRPA